MVKPWPLVSSHDEMNLGLFKVTRDQALSPRTQAAHDFFVVHMPDWLQIVPVTIHREVVLVRQYRHGSRRISLEVPGGLIDPEDIGAAAAAARELAEETGFGGGEIISLGEMYPQPAMLANRVRFFAGQGVKPVQEQQPDAGEDIEVVLVRPDELDDLIADGRIHNAMTVLALALARQARVI